MKIVITGGHGFLGWHLRARLRALTSHDVVALGRHDFGRLTQAVRHADAVVHIAGVNRGSDSEVEKGNIDLAHSVAKAVAESWDAPRLVFANSIQCGNDTPYGRGKAEARDILTEAARSVDAPFVDVILPNLFGEHGRPDYNSFVATFAHAVANGSSPTVSERPVELVHAQRAAQELIDACELRKSSTRRPEGELTSVASVWERLKEAHRLYRSAEIPQLTSQFDVDLFNTLRAAMFPSAYPMLLPVHRDRRGGLVECARVHGGQGQSFVSTSARRVTRGEHFHLGKVERFVVLRGQARISLRRLFHDEIISFEVSGDEPAVVDMPTMWVHNITNVGQEELVTFFWTHTLFDPERPDTFAEAVEPRVGSR